MFYLTLDYQRVLNHKYLYTLLIVHCKLQGESKKRLLFEILRWHLLENYLSYGAVLFRTWSTHEYINLRKGHLPRTNGSLVIATSFLAGNQLYEL